MDEANTDQNVQLVQGIFSPAQAHEIILSLITQKINFHKMEEVQLWEKNHDTDLQPLKNRILELEKEKVKAKKFIEEVAVAGKKLEINSTLQMKMID
jgi:hypothetical protein